MLVTCRFLKNIFKNQGRTISSVRILVQTEIYVLFTLREGRMEKQGFMNKKTNSLTFVSGGVVNVAKSIDKALFEICEAKK